MTIMKTTLLKLGLVAAMAVTSTVAQAGSITAKGSDTLVILAQKWAETYMAKTPGTTIQVTGGGWFTWDAMNLRVKG